MKNFKTKLLSFTLCASLLCGFVTTTGCGDNGKKASLKGTALAEALLAKERINHDHLSQSFDFLENRMEESAQTPTAGVVKPLSTVTKSSASTKGEVAGTGNNAVYSWKAFEKLVKELSYFESHFAAGQSVTERVDYNISTLENFTDVKDKWVAGASYMNLLMQVDESQETIYAEDTVNNTYSVGIRKVNDEINTTYEYYEKQENIAIRTLATPNRAYEYTTVSESEVTAFSADNDNGYWRFVQLYSHDGRTLSLNVLIMTDDLAYSFRVSINEQYSFEYEVTLISPDLQYEIAMISGDEITIYPAAFDGIRELRVSQAEQTALGEFGSWIGYNSAYGYYHTYAAPHIVTAQGEIAPPVKYSVESGGIDTHPSVLDENVGYVEGNVESLWESVYPSLTFEVQGDDIGQKFDNLHAALAKYGVTPIYDQTKIGQMAADVLKLTSGFTAHYAWDDMAMSSYENAMQAYQLEKDKMEEYENAYEAAARLPEASKKDLLEASQNAGFAALNFAGEASVAVDLGEVTLNGLSATVAQNDTLEEGERYVLKLALKKNTLDLEELIVLDNPSAETITTYQSGALTLSLDGAFFLPETIAAGEYDLVAYAATADGGIRVSKFQRVLCIGEVDDKFIFEDMEIHTTLTAEKVLRSTYSSILDIKVKQPQEQMACSYDDLVAVMENAVLDKGYFAAGATLERYDIAEETYVPVEENLLTAGTYRMKYLAQSDGGEVEAYVYCDIRM